MNVDPENVRVDLLKFRRKAYLTYPEGSDERRNFLKTILKNELALAQQEVPHEMLNFILETKEVVFWDIAKKATSWLVAWIICVVVSTITARYTKIAYLLIPLSSYFLYLAIKEGLKYVSYQKHLKTVEKYSDDIRKHMENITKNIRRLEGPRDEQQ